MDESSSLHVTKIETNDPCVPWRHRRREMMAIARIILVAKWLAKIQQQSDVGCRLCKRARKQCGASTENLQDETYGHFNSALSDGMATTVTAANHFIYFALFVWTVTCRYLALKPIACKHPPTRVS